MSPRRNVASLSLAELAVPIGTEPMEARLVDDLPEEPAWQFEPKWDGFRCLGFRDCKQYGCLGSSPSPTCKCSKPPGRHFLAGILWTATAQR
jgi:hypothetical protein